MKTDDLILLLTAAQQPVDTGLLHRRIWLAAIFGALAVAALVALTFGPRVDLALAIASGAMPAKALFGALVAATALAAFERSLRPGLEARSRLALVALPVIGVMAWAGVALAHAPAGQWSQLVFGRLWLSCLVTIPIYALAPLAATALIARQGAPVHPRLTGACAGLASAGLATIGYSIHCPEDAAPFIASWYPLAMAIMAGLGALVFPRLVRW